MIKKLCLHPAPSKGWGNFVYRPMNENKFNPYQYFNQFYGNPAVQKIAQNQRWTMSTNKKMPIDMKVLLEEHRIQGASIYGDHNPYISLYELTDNLPTAINATYSLNAMLDGIVILDIEPKCPDNIKLEMLQLPFLYAEVSMSGNGIHLILPAPYETDDDKTIVQTCAAMQEENKWYEFLINHNITFTKRVLVDYYGNVLTGGNANVRKWWDPLVKKAKDRHIYKTTNGEELLEEPEIYAKEEILDAVINRTREYGKTLDDFKGNHSSYEFGMFSYYSKHVLNYIKTIRNHTYTDNEIIWLLYLCVKEKLEPRDKHNELRNGIPYLLYSAERIYQSIQSRKNKKG